MASTGRQRTRGAAKQAALVLKGVLGCSLVVLASLSPFALASDAKFVGNQACTSCHEAQANDWTNSHHNLAMQVASSQAVLGNFDGAKLCYEGVTTTFFKKGSDFWVNTDNENGELQDYPVEYVFGVYQLQQLLLPTTHSSLHALSRTCDRRSTAGGGKLWYHIEEGQEAVTAERAPPWTDSDHEWHSRYAQ